MKTIKYAIILSLALCAVSCRQSEEMRDEGLVRISAVAGMPDVKSAFSGSETAVNSVLVAAYRSSDGTLAASAAGSGNTVSIPLAFGAEYEILMLCNASLPGQVPSTLAAARKVDVDISEEIASSGIFPGGLPMAGDTLICIPRSRNPLILNVQRMVARWDFRFVDADGVGMKVDSVRLRGCPVDFQPWAVDSEGNPCSKARMVTDGDWSTARDISIINSDLGVDGGNSAPFYVLENMRGNLLPSGTGQWERDPGNPDLMESGLCTYAEVGVSMDSGSEYYRMPAYSDMPHDLVYRCFLGDDMEGNFDVHRNRKSSLVMKGTQASLDMVIVSGEQSWRTQSYLFNDKYYSELTVLPASATLRIGGTLKETAITGSSGAMTWSSSNPSVARVTSTGLVTALSRGNAAITVTQSAAGSYGEMTASSAIRVVGKDPRLRIYPVNPVTGNDEQPYVKTLDYGGDYLFHAVCSSGAVPVWTVSTNSRSLIKFVGGDSNYVTTGDYARIKNIQSSAQSSGEKDVYVNVRVPSKGEFDSATETLMIMVQ